MCHWRIEEMKNITDKRLCAGVGLLFFFLGTFFIIDELIGKQSQKHCKYPVFVLSSYLISLGVVSFLYGSGTLTRHIFRHRVIPFFMVGSGFIYISLFFLPTHWSYQTPANISLCVGVVITGIMVIYYWKRPPS